MTLLKQIWHQRPEADRNPCEWFPTKETILFIPFKGASLLAKRGSDAKNYTSGEVSWANFGAEPPWLARIMMRYRFYVTLESTLKLYFFRLFANEVGISVINDLVWRLATV